MLCMPSQFAAFWRQVAAVHNFSLTCAMNRLPAWLLCPNHEAFCNCQVCDGMHAVVLLDSNLHIQV